MRCLVLLPLLRRRQMSAGDSSGHLDAFGGTRLPLVQISVNHSAHQLRPALLTRMWALIGYQISPRKPRRPIGIERAGFRRGTVSRAYSGGIERPRAHTA